MPPAGGCHLLAHSAWAEVTCRASLIRRQVNKDIRWVFIAFVWAESDLRFSAGGWKLAKMHDTTYL